MQWSASSKFDFEEENAVLVVENPIGIVDGSKAAYTGVLMLPFIGGDVPHINDDDHAPEWLQFKFGVSVGSGAAVSLTWDNKPVETERSRYLDGRQSWSSHIRTGVKADKTFSILVENDMKTIDKNEQCKDENHNGKCFLDVYPDDQHPKLSDFRANQRRVLREYFVFEVRQFSDGESRRQAEITAKSLPAALFLVWRSRGVREVDPGQTVELLEEIRANFPVF
jgi:hypothetical protein